MERSCGGRGEVMQGMCKADACSAAQPSRAPLSALLTDSINWLLMLLSMLLTARTTSSWPGRAAAAASSCGSGAAGLAAANRAAPPRLTDANRAAANSLALSSEAIASGEGGGRVGVAGVAGAAWVQRY